MFKVIFSAAPQRGQFHQGVHETLSQTLKRARAEDTERTTGNTGGRNLLSPFRLHGPAMLVSRVDLPSPLPDPETTEEG